MGTMVIEVPAELKCLGEAMADSLAAVRSAMARAGSGKSVDYAEVEVAIGAASARIERASHESILRSLDVDRPAVLIGGVRYARV